MAAARKKRTAKRKAPVKRKPGRPTKRTPEVERVIFETLRQGCSLRGAAAAGGISWKTMLDWRRSYPGFYASCEKAVQETRNRLAGKLYQKALDGDVTCLIWWQKCRDPEFREPREQAIHLDVGQVTSNDGIANAVLAALSQAASGEISASAAKDIADAGGRAGAVLDLVRLEKKIDALKEKLEGIEASG